MAKIARWVPPLVLGAVWTSLGVATEIWPADVHWWAIVAPSALLPTAGLLVTAAWWLRGWWLTVAAGLLVVLPSAPWWLDWFLPSTSFTMSRGYEMSQADELFPLFLLQVTQVREVLLPGLLLAALFGFLVTGTEGWAPLLGTGLGVLVFAVGDLVDRFNAVRLEPVTRYTGSFERLPPHLPEYGTQSWPDPTSVAVCFGLLVWAVVRRDQVVAVTAAVFGGVVWALTPPEVQSPGMQFLPGDLYRDAIVRQLWEDVPGALTPACVLLASAALAYLLRAPADGRIEG
ncbi:MAG: hypothetical protein ABIQ18_10630 [Umezawaea sp.]